MTHYRARIDRAGWALAIGGAAWAVAAVLLALHGGIAEPLTLFALAVAAGVGGALAIAGIAGPCWWLLQRGGRRGPVAAGAIGAGVAALATLAVLTRGFGAGLPVVDGATLTAIWTSAAASALAAGFLGALVALAMWLVSYRAV